MTRVMVAMSGGVDSTAAAKLVTDLGYDAIGATMILHDDDGTDVGDARRAAEELGIEHVVLDMRDVFRARVMEPFARSYASGRTPNPCVECNRHIKFGALMEASRRLGCDKLATGHYARIVRRGGMLRVAKALHKEKDQSYFLHMLGQRELAAAMFPLGEMTKDQARAILREAGIENAERAESQDICFVGPDGCAAEASRILGTELRQGSFVTADGRVLGRHRGIGRYTIGQHKKLGISVGRTMYVTDIDAGSGAVTLGAEEDLMSGAIEVRDFAWSSGEPPEGSVRCCAKIRYRSPDVPAMAEALDAGRVRITFDSPVRAPARGQFAVLYDGDDVIGGGEIECRY